MIDCTGIERSQPSGAIAFIKRHPNLSAVIGATVAFAGLATAGMAPGVGWRTPVLIILAVGGIAGLLACVSGAMQQRIERETGEKVPFWLGLAAMGYAIWWALRWATWLAVVCGGVVLLLALQTVTPVLAWVLAVTGTALTLRKPVLNAWRAFRIVMAEHEYVRQRRNRVLDRLADRMDELTD